MEPQGKDYSDAQNQYKARKWIPCKVAFYMSTIINWKVHQGCSHLLQQCLSLFTVTMAEYLSLGYL